MAESAPLLQAQRLGLQRGGRVLLHGVDLHLRRGERLGLLGLNGAGKSTLLHALAGQQRPYQGTVRLLGADLYGRHPPLSRLSLVTECPPAVGDMTCRQWLLFCARMQGLSRAEAQQSVQVQVERYALQDRVNCLPAQLSRGQQQRLSLARAALHEPELWLLDEPCNGLDPLQARRIRAYLRALDEQAGLIIASHLAEDLALCHRILLLRDGRIRARWDADTFRQQPAHHWLEAEPC